MDARLTPAEILADFERFSRECEEAEYTDTGEAWEYLDALAACVRSMLDGSMNDDTFEDLQPDILLTEPPQDPPMNEGPLVDPDLLVMGPAYHENSPRPGDRHLESECPGGDEWPCSMNGPAK